MKKSHLIAGIIVLGFGVFVGYFIGTGCVVPVRISGDSSGAFDLIVSQHEGNPSVCCPPWASWSVQKEMQYKETMVLCHGDIAVNLSNIVYRDASNQASKDQAVLLLFVEGNKSMITIEIGNQVREGRYSITLSSIDKFAGVGHFHIARKGLF